MDEQILSALVALMDKLGYDVIAREAPQPQEVEFPGDDASADEVAAFIEEHGYLVESDSRNARKLKPRELPTRYIRAFSRVDFAVMVAGWTDAQVKKHNVANMGIWNMAPGVEWHDELNDAFDAEFNRRFPSQPGENHGMGGDQRQQ